MGCRAGCGRHSRGCRRQRCQLCRDGGGRGCLRHRQLLHLGWLGQLGRGGWWDGGSGSGGGRLPCLLRKVLRLPVAIEHVLQAKCEVLTAHRGTRENLHFGKGVASRGCARVSGARVVGRRCEGNAVAGRPGSVRVDDGDDWHGTLCAAAHDRKSVAFHDTCVMVGSELLHRCLRLSQSLREDNVHVVRVHERVVRDEVGGRRRLIAADRAGGCRVMLLRHLCGSRRLCSLLQQLKDTRVCIRPADDVFGKRCDHFVALRVSRCGLRGRHCSTPEKGPHARVVSRLPLQDSNLLLKAGLRHAGCSWRWQGSHRRMSRLCPMKYRYCSF
eukprot:Rhum_TRINITY_DN13058_c0_g1::Rhum_TRINITY_DN13058_c0_g1_i1::g.56575::m.56575